MNHTIVHVHIKNLEGCKERKGTRVIFFFLSGSFVDRWPTFVSIELLVLSRMFNVFGREKFNDFKKILLDWIKIHS